MIPVRVIIPELTDRCIPGQIVVPLDHAKSFDGDLPALCGKHTSGGQVLTVFKVGLHILKMIDVQSFLFFVQQCKRLSFTHYLTPLPFYGGVWQ